MSKRFKLKISHVIPSFQLCRSKKPSRLPEIPGPVTHRLSPMNPKAVDICYPNHPVPPPSTPEYSFVKGHLSPKIASVGCGCRGRSCTRYLSPDVSFESLDYLSKEEIARSHVAAKADNSKVQRKKEVDKKKKKLKGMKASVSSRDSECFSSEGIENEENETLMLISTSRSFSDDSSFELDQSLADQYHMGTIKSKKNVNNGKKIMTRLKSFGSKKDRGPSMSRGALSSENNETPAIGSMSRRMMVQPLTAEQKVSESVAVVTKSDDPYEDFKRSMLEMILEKQIFEAKDLEQLLQCFLSLNSRQYHEIIVEAFTEIWEALFYDYPLNALQL